ncbi:MAG: DNA repair protein RecN [Deltaproteobacteria bacterium]|nr:DNA repair protein RecN [Deltaproteobacteria bacterium]
MLRELAIRNFAIIDEMRVSFQKGLTVLSGETGAGKSIIIGAVNLLLGERAHADMIRSNEDSAVVEASFAIGEMGSLKDRLHEAGYSQGDELVIRRVVSRSGRNRIYINGNLATLAMLTEIGESLVNICGQHEHQVILNADSHIDILDEYGELLPLRKEYEELYEVVRCCEEQIGALRKQERQRAEREDYLRFVLGEIDQANLQIDEEASLMRERQILDNSQRLGEYVEKANDGLYGRSGSVLEELRNAVTLIREIRKIDGSLQIPEQDLDDVYYRIEDWTLTLREYAKKLVFDPQRAEAVRDRLEWIGRLKRKYGGSLKDILDRRSETAEELNGLLSIDDEIKEVQRVYSEKEGELLSKALVLSERRREVSLRLKEAVEGEIGRLRMEAAGFEVRFAMRILNGDEKPSFTTKGIDSLEFYLATNPGEDMKPLNRIASGGELSRIILSLKKVLAKAGSVGTIVFDEVDSGIGGATAEMVGQVLKDVAANHQVLCITHLPQIACFADHHYRVSKLLSSQRATTSIEILSDRDRIEEIARMLGGIDVTEKTRDHAREMLVASQGSAGAT